MKIIEAFEPVYEMANYTPKKTGLPYRIWLDSSGMKRQGLQHDNRRIKLFDSDNNCLELSIDPPFDVKAGDARKFKKLKEVRSFLQKFQSVIEMHYNQEIEDTDLGNIFMLVTKKHYNLEDAIKYVLEDNI